MAHSTLSVLSPPEFPQPQLLIVQEDQAAVEQARRELGPGADPKQILSRAQQIKHEREPNSLVWRIAPVPQKLTQGERL